MCERSTFQIGFYGDRVEEKRVSGGEEALASAEEGEVAFPAAHLAAHVGHDAVKVPPAQVGAQALQAALLPRRQGCHWKNSERSRNSVSFQASNLKKRNPILSSQTACQRCVFSSITLPAGPVANWVCLCVTDANKERSCRWNKTVCLIVICEFPPAKWGESGRPPAHPLPCRHSADSKTAHTAVTDWFYAP